MFDRTGAVLRYIQGAAYGSFTTGMAVDLYDGTDAWVAGLLGAAIMFVAARPWAPDDPPPPPGRGGHHG